MPTSRNNKFSNKQPKFTPQKKKKKKNTRSLKLETKKTTEKNNETKSWFFEKINIIDKPLTGLTKEKKKRTQSEMKEMFQLISQKCKG